MKLNAEAMRPGTTFTWKNILWKVLANDTLERRLYLEKDDDGSDHTLGYEPGISFDCIDVPHHRSE